MTQSPTIVVAHPSADLYGSDLQLLETVKALVEGGAHVVVAIPRSGRLRAELEARGATVRILPFPVLRKAALRPLTFLRLALDCAASLPRIIAFIRSQNADSLIVNTITIPWWLPAARLARMRTVVHVHEAEDDGPRAVRLLLALPNLLAGTLVVNSRASASALVSVLPVLARRLEIVYNGVPGPPQPPTRPRTRNVDSPLRLVFVGRLSPRKGTDVALDALELLVHDGVNASLDLYGTAFDGYEWFEQQLRERANCSALTERVSFHGYVNPVWPALHDADIVLVPSRVEPFGNTAVEALLARRPLVASNTQGLSEIIVNGTNGLQAEPGDPRSLAESIQRLAADPGFAQSLAETGWKDATMRFGTPRYQRRIRELMHLPEPLDLAFEGDDPSADR